MKNTKKPVSYNEAGVDIQAGDTFVEEIVHLAESTNRMGAIGKLGGFGGLFDINKLEFEKPILVASTDGVGTKLLLAIEANKHESIGVDLVAMCVNDLIVQGAEPLFFLDYYATGKLNNKVSKSIIKGIVDGCKQSNMALIGGETAEMPDVYTAGKYDLAGFSVGIVEQHKLITGSKIAEQDVIIGLHSSGLHSNGFSLVRKIIKETKKNGVKTPDMDELLVPTAIYVKPILALLKKFELKGIVHVTGGGITNNLPRILSPGLGASIELHKIHLPKIFKWIMKHGPVELPEMLRTFNCGIGMLLIIDPSSANAIQDELDKLNQEHVVIGRIKSNNKIEYLGTFSNL